MRLPNEMEDEELLIYVLYRKPPPFSQVCACSFRRFDFQCVKFWRRWVMREDRNPISMMWALALPGVTCCLCLKRIYLEVWHRQNMAGREFSVRSLVRRPPSADRDGPGQVVQGLCWGSGTGIVWRWAIALGLLGQGVNSALVLHRLILGCFQHVLESRCMPTQTVEPQPQPLASCLTNAAQGQSSWRCAVMSSGELSNKAKTSPYIQLSAVCCH